MALKILLTAAVGEGLVIKNAGKAILPLTRVKVKYTLKNRNILR
jgi:hypothetical protein